MERIVFDVLCEPLRLCRLIFALSASQHASSSGEADPRTKSPQQIAVERIVFNVLRKKTWRQRA
jgi:hypothetical protein